MYFTPILIQLSAAPF